MNEEPDYLVLLKQQLVKERIQNAIVLSHIDESFYQDLNKWRVSASKEENEEAHSLLLQLVRARIGKILCFSDVQEVNGIHDRLAKEEKSLYQKIHQACIDFNSEVFNK
jgi:DNA replication initiation complex subunit (GINS family)